MKTPINTGRSVGVASGWKWLVAGLVLTSILLQAVNIPAGSVYENKSEFFTAGDFNGDGIPDVLVLDKVTGNARVGYADTNGNLAWSAPLITGVDTAAGCAVGRLLVTNRDVVAVTEPGFNRVNLVDLSNSNAAPSPVVIIPNGVGPHSLVTLASVQSNSAPSYNFLVVASSFNAPPNERLDLLAINAGVGTPNGQFSETGPFDRPNAVQLFPDDGTLAAGLVRGTNDTLDIWQFSNAPSILLSLSNLPPGSDYAFGDFNGEALPRFLYYQPGQSNVFVVQLLQTNGSLAFGPPLVVSFSNAVLEAFYTALGSDGAFQINFGGSIQGLRLPGGAPALSTVYTASAGSAFTGLAPLAGGTLALLDAPIGSGVSAHAQVLQFNGTNYTQRSSGNLPATTTRGTRPDVWLFRNEPFVKLDPGFIESLNSPDWTVGVSGIPGTVLAQTEADGGPTNGLGNTPSTNNLGAAPGGTAFALPNQYNDVISVFSYASPRPVEAVSVTISPPAGSYSGPVQFSFGTLNLSDLVFYQAGATDSWHQFTLPVTLNYSATVNYYGTNAGSSSRSRLQSATYALANGNAPQAPIFINPNGTNPPPVTNTNTVTLASGGTIFYGRQSGTTGTIWSINLDGSGETYITSGARPRASRDGRWLAFLRDNNPFANTGDLWVRDLTTGMETLLLINSNTIVDMDWDVTGTNIVFDYGCNFYEIGLSGILAQLPLPILCNKYAPAVNPVDGRLAYFNLNFNSPGIYVSSADRTSSQSLNVGVTGARWPEWSADGKSIAFASGDTSFSVDAGMDLYVLNGDGSGLNQITGISDGTNGFPHGALWTPLGSGLVGAGTIYGTNGIWVIPLTADHTACDCPEALVPLPVSPGDPVDFVGSVIPLIAPPITNFPGLHIRLDQTMVVVYWSTNYQDYTLAYSTNMPGSPWRPISGPYFIAGGNFEYRLPKTSLTSEQFFRLQLTGAMVVTPSQPQITITLQGNQAVLYWPTNYIGFSLETTTNISPPAVWTRINGPYPAAGDLFQYQESDSGLPRAKYYRLRYP